VVGHDISLQNLFEIFFLIAPFHILIVSLLQLPIVLVRGLDTFPALTARRRPPRILEGPAVLVRSLLDHLRHLWQDLAEVRVGLL
jgi:hypothetical protein